MKISILTGNIGSGKSTVAEELRRMGYPVISADSMMRDIYLTDPGVRAVLIAKWGPDALDPLVGLSQKVRDEALDDTSTYEFLSKLIHEPMANVLYKVIMSPIPRRSHVFLETAVIDEWIFTGSALKLNGDSIVDMTFKIATTDRDARIDRVVTRYKKRFNLDTECTGFYCDAEENYARNRKTLARFRSMVIRTDELQDRVNAEWEGDARIGTVHTFLNDCKDDPKAIACSIRNMVSED